jgi:cysteine desulfurase
VDPREVERTVREISSKRKAVLVSIMHANNEVGTIQPVEEIAQRVRPLGALVHTDAAQTVGKVPARVEDLGVDLLSVAGHKFYGPKGIGALYARRGTRLAGLVLGADHEMGLRAGTENVAGVAGLGEACRLAEAHVAEEQKRLCGLRDRLWDRLHEAIPDLRRNGHTEYVLPNTLHVSFPGVPGRDVLMHCPGVAASTGSACHEGDSEASGVLGAMGVSLEGALGAVRLSLGRWTSEEEVDLAAARLAEAWSSSR